MTDWKWIPLLSPKPFRSFTPEEFREYVRSLYQERKKAAPRTPKPKKEKPPFSFRLNAKGTLIVKVNRDPKWLSIHEIEIIAKESGKPLNEVWLKLVGPKSKTGIRVSTAEAEEEAEVFGEIPW